MARKMGINERTVREWLRLTDEEQLDGISQDSLGKLVAACEQLNLRPENYQQAPPIWDWHKSYSENVDNPIAPPPRLSLDPLNPRARFLGKDLRSPFGVSASVLTSTPQRVHYFFHTGCDIVTLKTVRSRYYKGHPTPNVLFCSPRLTVLSTDEPLPSAIALVEAEEIRSSTPGMVNHFGVPSRTPEEWRQFIKSSLNSRFDPDGQLIIQSIIGTASKTSTREDLVTDFIATARLAVESGVDVIEINGSCPNAEAQEGKVYHDTHLAVAIAKGIREALPQTKILFKSGYLSSAELYELVMELAPYVDGFTGINTLPVLGTVNEQDGRAQSSAFGGAEAGLSGEPIRAHGLRFVETLANIRSKENLNHLGIAGMGGVTTPEHVHAFLTAGADIVQATTIFFDEPLFGSRVAEYLRAQQAFDSISSRDIVRTEYFAWEDALTLIRKEGLVISDDAAFLVYRNWHAGQQQLTGALLRPSILGVAGFAKRLRAVGRRS